MQKTIRFGCATFFAFVIAVIVAGNLFGIPGESKGQRDNQVVLEAKPWNNGYVHVWHTIVETPGVQTPFTDVREGTHCTRLDNEIHALIGEPPLIYYYHVDCGGVQGYVELDQAR